ncbi:hypothetical protein PtA15_1A428 [Puccinia triticina]|uniref:Uncharacterized protein n=1 Tax=Puccinia triticina TaxID=208348 RepID=A0ABY7C8G3_9BASI|nr:uncharacterized protein PtA15_1A428 [Puccinia triticina]WAQ81090.1 hypothetical protein PtA15_1A428 [Puccinia triticina]
MASGPLPEFLATPQIPHHNQATFNEPSRQLDGYVGTRFLHVMTKASGIPPAPEEVDQLYETLTEAEKCRVVVLSGVLWSAWVTAPFDNNDGGAPSPIPRGTTDPFYGRWAAVMTT